MKRGQRARSPAAAGTYPVKQPQILLADDHTLVVEGLKKLLEPHFDVVGAVEDGRALLAAAQESQPDVVLADISMPLLNGIDAARQLQKTAPDAKIIFLSMHSDPSYVSEAFEVGASGYLLKSSVATELVFAIEEVLKGRFYVTPSVTKGLVGSLVEVQGSSRKEKPDAFARLTPRQREVLQLIAEGKAVKEAASILSVSVKTIEFHKSRIANELGIRTTAELTKYAIAHGLVSL